MEQTGSAVHMLQPILNIVKPFTKPTDDADLVVFCDRKNYTAYWETEEYLKTCMAYAKDFAVYLVTGKFVLSDHLCMALIDPAGEVVGAQKAIHLTMAYRSLFTCGSELSVFDTQLGKLFLCVDVDIYHSEVLRTAALEGAQVIISSHYADPVDSTPECLMRTVWNAAQTNGVYVVYAVNAQSAVACPCCMTRHKDGYQVKPTQLFPIRTTLDLERLFIAEDQFPIKACANTVLCHNYLKQLTDSE